MMRGALRVFSVMPENSSSGIYSDGKARKGALDEEQVNILWNWIARFESDASRHALARVKGSGAFRLTTPDGGGNPLSKTVPISVHLTICFISDCATGRSHARQ